MVVDFNSIRGDMEEFNSCIDKSSFAESNTTRGNMSWSNGQEGRNWKWVKLDKALVDINIVNQFYSARLEYLTR